VPTPVWAAEGGRSPLCPQRARLRQGKRRRRDPRMLVAPCTVRGKPLGAPFERPPGCSRREEATRRSEWLASRYGLGRELFEWTNGSSAAWTWAYLEITPGAWEKPGTPSE